MAETETRPEELSKPAETQVAPTEAVQTIAVEQANSEKPAEQKDDSLQEPPNGNPEAPLMPEADGVPVEKKKKIPPDEEPEDGEEMEMDINEDFKLKCKPKIEKVLADLASVKDTEKAIEALNGWLAELEEFLAGYPKKKYPYGYPAYGPYYPAKPYGKKPVPGYPPAKKQEDGIEIPGGYPPPDDKKKKKFPEPYLQSADFDVEEVQSLLTNSAKKIEEQDGEMSGLRTQIAELQKYREEIQKLQNEEHDRLVEKAVLQEVAIGLISSDAIPRQKEIYGKLSNEDLKARMDALKEAKPIEVKRQSLKAAETPEASGDSEDEEKMKSIFARAGVNWETWKASKQK